MRRLLLLAGSLLLAASAPLSAGLRAGAATADITPPEGVSLDGAISQNGVVRAVHDRLHARALVLADDDTRLAIVICDSTMVWRRLYDRARKRIRKRVGIRPDRVLMAATHTHATPRASGISQETIDKKYYRQLEDGLVEAVVKAAKRLAPAKVGWGVGKLAEMPTIRRKYLKEGTKAWTPFGPRDERVGSVRGRNKTSRPSGPVDPRLPVLSVEHADGTPLAILAAFSIHYVGGYEPGHVSADYFGVVPKVLRKKLGGEERTHRFVGLMANGNSGNVGSPRQGGPPWSEIRRVGRKVAEKVLEVRRTIDHRSVPIAMREKDLTVKRRVPSEERLAWAKERWPAVRAKLRADKRLRWPEVYVKETMHVADMPKKEDLRLQAVRIGELGITAIPCEVFTQTGLALARKSPLSPTFNIELANGAAGYLPPPKQHRLGGYETWLARTSRLEVHAEPKIRSTLLDLLHELAKARRDSDS